MSMIVTFSIFESLLRGLGSKLWLDSQLVHRLNDHAEIMTQHLAECFVDLRGFGFTSQPFPKLCLNHRKGCFDVRPLVIVHQEFFALEAVEVEKLLPEIIAPLNVDVRLKR